MKNELLRRGFNSRHLHLHFKQILILNKTILFPSKIRLIGKDGKLVGILPYEEALLKAKEQGLDLVEVTKKTDPPVYKLGDSNKIRYEREKKQKLQKFKERQAAPKSIRIGFNESSHDLLTKVKKIEEFLNDDRIVNIEMRLRGREKAHGDLARSNIENFLTFIKISFKIIQPLKRYPQGFIVTLKKN
ncbi:MAG: translation initiation factor IF-3 [Candidatus Paceibacterota bacterium]